MQTVAGVADDKVNLARLWIQASLQPCLLAHCAGFRLSWHCPNFLVRQDEEVRQAARAQFSALCTKLDALSHLHFT